MPGSVVAVAIMKAIVTTYSSAPKMAHTSGSCGQMKTQNATDAPVVRPAAMHVMPMSGPTMTRP